MKNRFPILILWLLFAGLVVSSTTRAVAGGERQEGEVPLGNQWTLAQPIPGYDDEATAPYMIADSTGRIHAFNSVRMNRNVVIVYSQWTRTTGWSSPVDILLTPIKNQARIQGALLDEAGYVHLIFWGGDDLEANMYYSKAHVSQLGRAQAWITPQLIGDSAITPTAAVLVGDGKDSLSVVYSGDRDGIGLYSVFSNDGGETWTEPYIVALVLEDEHWPTALSMIQGSEGSLHLVWTLVSISGNGEAVLYTRYDPLSGRWLDPFTLAVRNPGDYEADWPAIVEYGGELLVVYQDSFPATRWMRRSGDGGTTWSDPVRPFTHIGEYRHVAYVTDSAGYLHMLLGNRTPNNIHGMWHTVWLNGRWSELEPVISGPRIVEGPLNQHFDPTGPQAIISHGNLLMVTWWTDPGAGRNGVWFSQTTLNTPEEEAVPIPTQIPSPTPTTNPTEEALAGPTSTPAPFFANTNGSTTPDGPPNPAIFMLAGALPVAILLGLFLFIFSNGIESRR